MELDDFGVGIDRTFLKKERNKFVEHDDLRIRGAWRFRCWCRLALSPVVIVLQIGRVCVQVTKRLPVTPYKI